jgi:hypothetical protein
MATSHCLMSPTSASIAEFYFHIFLSVIIVLIILPFWSDTLYKMIEGWFPKSMYIANEKNREPDKDFDQKKYPDLFETKYLVIRYLIRQETFGMWVIISILLFIIQSIIHVVGEFFIPLWGNIRGIYFNLTTIVIDSTAFFVTFISMLNVCIRSIKNEILAIRDRTVYNNYNSFHNCYVSLKDYDSFSDTDIDSFVKEVKYWKDQLTTQPRKPEQYSNENWYDYEERIKYWYVEQEGMKNNLDRIKDFFPNELQPGDELNLLPKRLVGETLDKYAKRVIDWEKSIEPEIIDSIKRRVELNNREKAIEEIKNMLIECRIAMSYINRSKNI